MVSVKALKVEVDGAWLDSVDVNAIPVQVIGREDEGVWVFSNLAAARKHFPELDPYRDTDRFTAAMRGEANNAPMLRFETWKAYEVYSS